ncbi:hypothetical protein D9M68_628000 [compost metagenome]
MCIRSKGIHNLPFIQFTVLPVFQNRTFQVSKRFFIGLYMGKDVFNEAYCFVEILLQAAYIDGGCFSAYIKTIRTGNIIKGLAQFFRGVFVRAEER